MKVALIGAELEENLGLRYIASSLESKGHQVAIVPLNSEPDADEAIRQTLAFAPEIAGLSMIFTSRGREFCRFAAQLRQAGYGGHIIAGGPFASFNCERLVTDFAAFDSVALGEGEGIMCALAENLDSLERVAGLCYRGRDAKAVTNPATGNADVLDELPWPKRTTFHSYFDKPIASILTSRGCWRECAFCSINAWAVMDLLQNLHRDGATPCMVTHDPRFAKHAQREVHFVEWQSSCRRCIVQADAGCARMNRLVQDVRYALRQLLKSAGLTAVVTVTLALGIGAHTALFSVFLLRPLPYQGLQHLVAIHDEIPGVNRHIAGKSLWEDHDLRNGSAVFGQVPSPIDVSRVSAYGAGRKLRSRTPCSERRSRRGVTI